MAILLNMTRRVSFAIAQPITIVGWFLSSFLLIALIGAANTDHFRISPHSDHALTQAFYYAIIAAVLYFIIALLMVLTVYGATAGHYEKEFKLTVSQRTLMLQTMAFMGYLLFGALVFKYTEGWAYLDAVYWADFTLLTVGIGTPFTPRTHVGRSLLFPFAIGGIVSIGLVIGSIRSLVLERGKHKIAARFTEKKRESVLSTIDSENRTIKIGFFKKYKFSQRGLTEPQRREQEFQVMRRIQSESVHRRRWMSLALSGSAAMALWLIGALVFMITEEPQGWSYFVALYFSYTSLLTIGYGDYQPQSNSGKPFFVFWSLLAVPTLTILIANMGDTVIKMVSDLTIWAGKLTVMPDDEGLRAALKTTLKRFSVGRFINVKDFHVMQPPGILPQTEQPDRDLEKVHSSEHHALDRLASHVEDEELKEALEAGNQDDNVQRDIHLYHFVLVRELRHLIEDSRSDSQKEYSYRDWAWFLKLLGQDENDETLHRTPPVVPRRRRFLKGSKSKVEHISLGKAGGKDGDMKWSWLGTRSPLLGTKSESEWLIEQLGWQLEKTLRDAKSKDPSVRLAQPPIGFADLQKHDEETVREDRRDTISRDNEGMQQQASSSTEKTSNTERKNQ